MTIADMRVILGLGTEVSDAAVADAYAAYLEELEAEPADLLPLIEIKQHLKIEVDETDEDMLLSIYRAAAIANLDGPEGWLGRSLLERSIVRQFDGFDIGRLPYPPLIALTKIEQRTAAGAWVTVDPATYETDDGTICLVPGRSWPSGYGRVRVTWRAGYGAADGPALPFPIKAALLLMVGDLYRNRTTVALGSNGAVKVPMSTTVDNLLDPLRVYR